MDEEDVVVYVSPELYFALVAELDVDHPRKLHPSFVGAVLGIVKVQLPVVDVSASVPGPPEPPFVSNSNV